LEVSFQALASYPDRPSEDEVLRWLATGAAHVELGGDLGSWALIHCACAAASGAASYRGIIRQAATPEDFTLELIHEASRLRSFLGDLGYKTLLASVDAQ
jgi:hypothetical protein